MKTKDAITPVLPRLRLSMPAAVLAGLVSAGMLLGAAPVLGQGTDGVPGDRLVVPLPDISALSEGEARDLTRELAEANVISDNCPDHALSDGEWQLLNGTTDALMARLGLDPLAYDREYFRPAFNLLDDAQACETLGPDLPQVVARLVAMGGGTAPELPEPAAAPETGETEAAPAQ